MQGVIKILIILILLFGGFYIFKVAFPYLTKREVLLETGIAQKENFYVIKVFTLENNNTLKFNVPNFSDYVKFIFTPNISNKNSNIENISNLYSTIEYSIYDNNKLLQKKSFTFKSNYIQYIDKNGTIVKPVLYDKSDLIPTSSTSLKMNLNQFKRVTDIRFKIQSKDNNILDISMRGYFLERNPKEKVKKIWGHLATTNKIILFSDNVYPLYYITPEEKDIRLQALWKPNAPEGILGKNYKVRNLLQRKDMEGISPVTYIQPIIYSDSNISATRYLDSGNYEIYIKDTNNTNADIEVSLYNSDILVSDNNYSVSYIKLHPLKLHLSQAMILEINSNAPISYMIKNIDINQSLYLPAQTSSYYQIDNNQSITYELLQTQDRVIKIESRTTSMQNNILRVALKDNNGKIVKILEENLTFERSRYDYVDNFQVVSKPLYYILPLPDNISTISLSSDSPLLTKVYSRNFKIPYPLYTDKSYTDSESTILPTWFTLRPQQFSLFYIKSIRKYIYKQIKPPSISLYTQEGLYRYESLYPIDSIWQGYTILQKRDKDISYIRQNSWSSIYAQIDVDDNITLYSDVNATSTKAKLIIIQNRVEDRNISLLIDNIKIFNSIINSKVEVVTLPDITTLKNHNIRVSTIPPKNIEFFISNTEKENKTYIQKSFILFDKPLHFNFRKFNDTNETIKMEFAIEDSNNSNIYQANANIKGKFNKTFNLYNRFSFNNYSIFFKTANNSGYIINNRAVELNSSKSVSIPLGNNLNDNNYSLTLYPYRYNKKVYINLSHIGLGQEDITIRRQQ